MLFGDDARPPRFSDVARALRHPDVGIVIDLSAIEHAEKLSYVNELLPMLASLRRSVGLPHWIVVDEAQYFLHQPNERCIDFELAAYVMTTYQPSQLHPKLLQAIESIIVTAMTNPIEVHALAMLCGAERAEVEWGTDFRQGRIANLPESLAAPIHQRYEMKSQSSKGCDAIAATLNEFSSDPAIT